MPDPHVYPDAPSGPLTLAASLGPPPQPPAPRPDISPWMQIEQLNAGTDMFMSVAMFTGVASLPPDDLTLPTISLRASSIPPNTIGDAVVLTSTPKSVFQAPNNTTFVATARIVSQSNNVLVMTLRLASSSTVAKWEIQIKNNTAASADFTWVVSSVQANTVQPWLDVTPATLNYSMLKGETLSKSVQVANKGTGPFTITGVTPPFPGGANQFSLGALPPQLDPNSAVSLPVTFASDGTSPLIRQSVASITTTPTDAQATTTAGHNKQVSFNATVGQLEIALLLDASGSMAWDACGNFLSAADASLARWSELQSAVSKFLGLLAHFAVGKGQLGVARFPGTNPAQEFTYNAFGPQNIPDNSQVTTVLGQIFPANKPPTDSTPMGDGLDHVMAGPPSYFMSDPNQRDANQRWLILLSDGANNINPSGHQPAQFICKEFGGSVVGLSPFQTQKVSVYTAAYGVRGASNVDHETLANLRLSGFTGSASAEVDGTVTNTPAVCPPNGKPQVTPILAEQLAGAFTDAIKTKLTGSPSPADPPATFFSGQSEARHNVLIIPYDGRAAFSINWNTPQSDRLNLELLTPAHERITPFNIVEDFEGIRFISDMRFQTYLIDEAFMRGKSQAGESRFGNWTMIVSPPPIILGPPPAGAAAATAAAPTVFEQYTYDVMLRSDLTLAASLDKDDYYAGDQITVSADLTLRGVPVNGATVVLSTTAPDQAVDNWLAGLTVTPDALQRAQDLLKGQDSTPLLVKSVAAGLMGLTFPGIARETGTPMTEVGTTGTYRAVIANTSTPESRTFYVTAIGVTSDGTSFRRETKVSARIRVAPDPQFTLLNIVYPQAGVANLTAIPRDRFNNVVLLNPDNTGGFGFVVTGGTLQGSLVSNLDGTYSQTVQYQAGQTPTVGFQWHGQSVMEPQKLAPATGLTFVDRVIRFTAGLEGAPGANKHADPQVALGDVFQKPAGQFVSLGGRGALTVGINRKVMVPSADNDVTIFVQPDTDLRAYRVDVYVPPRPIFEGGVTVRVSLMEFEVTAPSHNIAITLQPAIPGLDFGTLWAALQHQSGHNWTNVWTSSHVGDLEWPVNRDKNLAQGRYRWAFFQSNPASGAQPIAFTFDFALPQAGKVITMIQIDLTDLANYLEQWGVPPDDSKDWMHLGDSSGSTASFGLAQAGVKLATALRIRDLSDRVFDANFDPLDTPGVSVLGAGVLKVADAATYHP